MTDDVREALAKTLYLREAGGLLSAERFWVERLAMRDEYLAIADAILAAFDVTPKGEARVTDNMVERAYAVFSDRPMQSSAKTRLRAALEAALNHADGSGA